MSTTELPERINVMKVVTYDVQSIREMLAELNHKEFEYVATDSEVMSVIENEVSEHFSDLKDLLWTNEDGEEL